MGFDASTFREPMDFDLSPWGGPKGTVPEPSTKDLQVYFNGVRKLQTPEVPVREGGEDDESFDARRAAFDAATDAENLKAAELLAVLSKGTITADAYVALPQRVKNSFSKWLMGELSPEA